MPQAVHFFIARDPHEATTIGERMGWQRMAADRFITPDALDVRVRWLPRNLNNGMPPETKVFFHASFRDSEKESDKENFFLFNKYATELNYVMTEIFDPEDDDAAE